MTERRPLLLAILLFTMTASSFQIFAIAVLAVDLITDLDLSRTALGLLGSLNTMVGALSAPSTGRLTDRIGPRRSAILVLAISAVGMALTAVSRDWLILALAAVVSGIPQGWGNPATNALIAERVPADGQGTVTGVKQSGVQFGIFLSGLTLPGLAVVIGWRGALWGYAVAFLLGAFAVARWLGPAPAEERSDVPEAERPKPAAPTGASTPAATAAATTSTVAAEQSIPPFIWLMSVYAFLYGSAGGAIGRFLPLWANEEIGMSVVAAGAVVAVGGLLGIAARIWIGGLPQTRSAPASLLSMLAIVGAVYCLILLLTETVGSWILWPASILSATGIGAWNAVAMLAVIVTVPRAAAGRASGIVMLGFLGGLSVGSPVAGLVVDRWGTYQPVWAATLVLSVLSALVIRPELLRRRDGAVQDDPAVT
ncbi:MAG: MFS transporter [Actinomycetota bacterium]